MSRPLKIGLVGCGWFAREAHLPALKRLEAQGAVEVVALCSLSSQSTALAARRLGRDVPRFTALHDVLRLPDLDAVDLTLPIPAMEGAIRAALEAGKHVVSEKPCAVSVSRAHDLIAFHAALDAAPVWAVAENWRFKRSVALLRRIVQDGSIGDLRSADFRHVTKAETANPGWRGASEFAGGHLLDSGVHFVALLRQVVGEVTEVSAALSRRERQFAEPDSVAACLRFADGVDGLVRLSFASHDAPGRSGLVLVGSEGTATADFMRSEITVAVGRKIRTMRVDGDPWVQGGVFELLDHSVRSMRTGDVLRATPAEAVADMAVIEAMATASRTGRAAAPASLGPAGVFAPPLVPTYGRMRDFHPRAMVRCETVDAVRAAVSQAVAAGLRVRPRGHGYSWAPHVATDGVSLSLDGLNRIGPVDPATGTVRVEAGARLGTLTRHLAAQGRAIPSLSFLSDASVGGAVATATHGTSPHWGTLSDFVESVTLVLPSGAVRIIDAGAEEELRAARASVGMLGVVVALELRTIPMPTVRFSRQRMSLDAFLHRRAAILGRYAHLWVNWTLGTDEVRLDGLEACTPSDAGARPYVVGDNALWQPSASPPTLISRARRKVRSVGGRVLGAITHRLRGVAGETESAWTSMQYGVPRTDIEGALGAIVASGFARAHAGRLLEFKFLAGSTRTMLGPNADGDAVLFNMWWQVDRPQAGHVFDAFEDVMIARKAKPHWGKWHRSPTLAYMGEAYAGWEAFAAVRDRLDPDRVFSIFDEDRPALRSASSLEVCR